jgi:hypothetical protein
MSDLEERVSKLERRIDYIEKETDIYYERAKFKQAVDSIRPEGSSVEYQEGFYGYFAVVSDIDGDQAQIMMDRFESRDLGHALTETGDGLGIEVWSDERA